MKTKLIKRILLMLMFISWPGIFLIAQDIHFSQFNTTPLNLNPANTGFFNGTHRLMINHRSQWSSVTIPYSTFSAGFDMHLLTRKFRQDIFGAGVVINRDKAGDSEFGTTQVNISFSYIKALNKRNNHFLSIGIQPGFAQRSINYTALKFDYQYNGEHYDPNQDNGEVFTNESFTFFDIGGGIHWYYQTGKRSNLNGGVSIFHLNGPKQSLLNNSDIRLDQKLTAYFNCQFELSDKIDLMPSFLVNFQGPYSEVIYGSKLKIIRTRNTHFYSAINIGLFIRHNDAAIVMLGLDHRKFNFGLSYDINYSGLSSASDSRGGFELSLIYTLNSLKQQKITEVPCPIF